MTGIRIGELLSLKVGQLETLVEEGSILIDRLERGPANHKAFLTSEERKAVKARIFFHQNQTLQAIVFESDIFLNCGKIQKILSLCVKQLGIEA